MPNGWVWNSIVKGGRGWKRVIKGFLWAVNMGWVRGITRTSEISSSPSFREDAMKTTRAWFQKQPSRNTREILATGTCLQEAPRELTMCHGCWSYSRDLESRSKSQTQQHVWCLQRGPWYLVRIKSFWVPFESYDIKTQEKSISVL